MHVSLEDRWNSVPEFPEGRRNFKHFPLGKSSLVMTVSMEEFQLSRCWPQALFQALQDACLLCDRAPLALLALFGFCLVSEGKVGGCDWLQDSGTRWLKLLQNSQGEKKSLT